MQAGIFDCHTFSRFFTKIPAKRRKNARFHQAEDAGFD
jgi:hypothetical protein